MDEIIILILKSELWARIFPAAAAIFAITQAVKYIFRIRADLPTPGATLLRLVACVAAYPITWAVMVADGNTLSHWALPIPHALIAWLLAHALAEYGMKVLYWWKPTLARAINADPERRQSKRPRPGKQPDRRRGYHGV